MKKQIIYIIIAIILIFIVTQPILIKVPLCTDIPEEAPITFITYDEEITESIRQDLEQEPFQYFRISGKSMEPSIKHNQKCVCVRKNNYEKGDIISFFVPTGDNKVELIAHRIIDKSNNYFTTKGDNNNIEDDYKITEENIFCSIPETSLTEKFKFIIGKNV